MELHIVAQYALFLNSRNANFFSSKYSFSHSDDVRFHSKWFGDRVGTRVYKGEEGEF